MSRNPLKKLLIEKIDDTDDEELLKAIYKLLDYKSSPGDIYILNENQKLAIKEAQEQIKNGEFISNDNLEREIDKWLNE